ncbi:stage VI sporulation protein D [Neobacillus piezotolerans]|uniref:Stage VI sporulation protein D n=1 Tax=Neobacillus piezotolerans TaxID=2259171 RepID=A0A3D8GPT4_9BACI|nr:stage VI sporulation protein D [Neobacillus piezotolerans]RDU36292.1 stage VI sporulation protein D [Neobacillus piezotolerans]
MKGGVALSQEKQSSLRFSLEESLWFRKGQEVDELVSISLSPDITIQENDQYVNIRGALDLSGEYVCQSGGLEDSEGAPGLRYVQSVGQREEGICEFAHRFPVDITIPVNRIASIYDIDVIVDSFDYSFTERSCMKLTADLIISGIYDGQSPEVEEEARDEPEEIVLTDRVFESVQDAEEEEEEEGYAGYIAEIPEEELIFEAEARRIPEEDPADNPAAFSAFPFQSYWNQFHGVLPFNPARSEDLQSDMNAMPVSQQWQEQEYEAQETAAEHHMEAEAENAAEEAESSSSVPQKQKKKKSKKKSMSLTEFFARKDEGDEQARMKVCIVQKGDTLDRISDRYSVSIQNLLRYNRLDLNQDVYEGQVLYIPAAIVKK